MFDNIYFYNLNDDIDTQLLEDNVDILIDYIQILNYMNK